MPPAPLRRPLSALVLLGVLLLAAVVMHGQPADPPAPAPTWLVNRPIGAALSPFMAADCHRGHCRADRASGPDLNGIRGLVASAVAVGGLRILNAHHQLRGAAVWAMDRDGDQVSVNAVRVSQAPAGWDGQTETLADGSKVSRWVLRTKSGIWLAEANANASSDCGGDDPEANVLWDIALNRVQPTQLHL